MKYLSAKPNVCGGDLVVKETRILIAIVLYRIRAGYSMGEIHEMYRWVDPKVLDGAIDEALRKLLEMLNEKHGHGKSGL